MSADNWTICPKCTKKKTEAVAEVRKLYGTISLEEFENQLKAANIAEANESPDETMREDWEIYFDAGYLVFSYGAQCMVCAFQFSLKKKYKLK